MRPETVDTTAATAGSSSQIRSLNSNPMTATVEDDDNDKNEQNINPQRIPKSYYSWRRGKWRYLEKIEIK